MRVSCYVHHGSTCMDVFEYPIRVMGNVLSREPSEVVVCVTVKEPLVSLAGLFC
jgi:hypothetical protein